MSVLIIYAKVEKWKSYPCEDANPECWRVRPTRSPLHCCSECLNNGQFINVITNNDSLMFRKGKINVFKSRQINENENENQKLKSISQRKTWGLQLSQFIFSYFVNFTKV